jgi:hypothetical protein
MTATKKWSKYPLNLLVSQESRVHKLKLQMKEDTFINISIHRLHRKIECNS